MAQSEGKISALKTGIFGSILTLIGIALSGPLGVITVMLVSAQPAWKTAALFAQHYHPIQTLPYFFGFLLITGYAITMAAIYRVAEEKQKTLVLVALLFTGAYSALIFLNYILQTTFVPTMARHYTPEYAALISAFSMANPLSLSWGIEMWGYALLGAATWFASVIFTRNTTEKITAGFMVLNGVFSIAGGFLTSFFPGWVLTLPGLVSFVLWNIIVFVLSSLIIASFRKRLAEIRGS